MHHIQVLKKELDAEHSLAKRGELVDAFFDLGRLSFNRPVLKNFYLGEARQLLEAEPLPDWERLLSILLELGRPQEAEALLHRVIENERQNPLLFLWMARVKFVQGDFLQVMTLLAFLNDAKLVEAQTLYRFWMGEDDHG